MADTRADLAIVEDTWTDLYVGTGIAVGTAVSI